MAGQYLAFLQNPSTSLLAADASLVYITTTTEIKEPNAILKHFQAQHKQVEKKEEKILNSIADDYGLCLETETTLFFKEGGGAYLPGIDSNFLDEKLVTLPMTHKVRFDAEQKIKQIRLDWDQGTMLKSVDIIGKNGRNWPIREGKAQIETINKSLAAGGRNTDVNGSSGAAPRGQHDVVIGQHKKRDSVSATRDPHASLALFAPRDPNEDTGPRQFEGPKTAPRESYKAPHRGLDTILAGDEIAETGSKLRSPSPTKTDGFFPKAGAGKHHVNNRLFDENEPTGVARSPERKKTFQQKNEHFEFGDGEDVLPENSRPTSGKSHQNVQTQIDFAAFSVSPGVKGKTRPDYEHNWGQEVRSPSPSQLHLALTDTFHRRTQLRHRPSVQSSTLHARTLRTILISSTVRRQQGSRSPYNARKAWDCTKTPPAPMSAQPSAATTSTVATTSKRTTASPTPPRPPRPEANSPPRPRPPTRPERAAIWTRTGTSARRSRRRRSTRRPATGWEDVKMQR